MREASADAAAIGRRLVIWLAALFTLGGGALGASGGSDERYGLRGTVGPYPVAMVITVRDRTQIVAAHFSYASRKRPIALTATMNGASVTLREPGGAGFDLHLVGPATQDDSTLTFHTSIGLAGTWTQGPRRLPVKLSLDIVGAEVRDCELYPDPPPSPGVHFPNPGCEHTPDKAVLDACIKAPFTTGTAAAECLGRAGRTCRTDQFDLNFCAGNLDAYLDQTLEGRVRAGNGPMTVQAYRRWSKAATATCERNSAFSPDGSGYGADITLCLAGDRLSLLQNGLKPPVEPIRR